MPRSRYPHRRDRRAPAPSTYGGAKAFQGVLADVHVGGPSEIHCFARVLALGPAGEPVLESFPVEARSLDLTDYFWHDRPGSHEKADTVTIAADGQIVATWGGPVLPIGETHILPLPKGSLSELPIEFGPWSGNASP